jgi:spore coat polysaccharide biosynthesis predicted glycosyltransferase SpsG/RimJ/RimL family protein N-acetyltransferase
MATVVFRCDGDDRIGAGHVSRCLQVARILRNLGTPVRIVGHVDGIAAALAADDGIEVVPPDPRSPAGVPDAGDPVVVDSYDIDHRELVAASQRAPLFAIVDEGPVPAVSGVISYHLDACRRLDVPPQVTSVLGPAYAPVEPRAFAARRARSLSLALVTLGASTSGRALLDPIVAALLELDDRLEVFAATRGVVQANGRVRSGVIRGGLTEQIAAADVAVSGAGSTPYELACAGVPALLVSVADNQLPVGRAFAEAGIALFEDARENLDSEALQHAISRLADANVRRTMAEAGPRAIDGYGAFRVAAALRASFDGEPLPRVVTYRPARMDDAKLLLEWRNDSGTRTASRNQSAVSAEGHRSWLTESLADESRTLLVAESAGRAVGTVRFDRAGRRAEIAVTVAPEERARRFGPQIIREAAELYLHAHVGVDRIRAEVRPENEASTKAFTRSGFFPVEADGELRVLEADAKALAHSGGG